MNQQLKDFLKQLEKELPPFCHDNDLIRFGIFSSAPTASRLRASGAAPKHFKLSPKKIRYLKQDVIDWVSTRYCTEDKNDSD